MTWRSVLKSNFKDTVFNYDRDIHKPLTRLRNDMEEIREKVIWISYSSESIENFKRIRNTYSGHFYDGGKKKEKPKEWLGRYRDSQEEVISEVESIVGEISQESDKKKREELIDSLMSDSILQRMDKSVLNPYTLAISRVLGKLGMEGRIYSRRIVTELREKHGELRKKYLLSQGYKKEYADVVFTKSFKDTVFNFDRDVNEFRIYLNKMRDKLNKFEYYRITYPHNSTPNNIRLRQLYKRYTNQSDNPDIHWTEREWFNRYTDSQEEVIEDIESILTEYLQEKDKDKKIELVVQLNDAPILGRIDNTLIKRYARGLEEFMDAVLGGRTMDAEKAYWTILNQHKKDRKKYLNMNINKSFKNTVFSHDRDVEKFKADLQSIRDANNKFYHKYKDKPEVANKEHPHVFWNHDSVKEYTRQITIGLNVVEDYLEKLLNETDEEEKEIWIQGFTSDYVMEKLHYVKNRYIQALAIFMHNKLNATIQPSKLNEMGVFTRIGIPVKKSFRDAVFGHDRDLTKLKNKINHVLNSLKKIRGQNIMRELDDRQKAVRHGGTYDYDGNFIDFKDPQNEGLIPSIDLNDIEREIPNHPKQLEEQIPLIMSHLDEITNEQDKNKRNRLIDDIIYPIDFKGTGRFPNGVAVAIVEYLMDVIEDFNEQGFKIF